MVFLNALDDPVVPPALWDPIKRLAGREFCLSHHVPSPKAAFYFRIETKLPICLDEARWPSGIPRRNVVRPEKRYLVGSFSRSIIRRRCRSVRVLSNIAEGVIAFQKTLRKRAFYLFALVSFFPARAFYVLGAMLQQSMCFQVFVPSQEFFHKHCSISCVCFSESLPAVECPLLLGLYTVVFWMIWYTTVICF